MDALKRFAIGVAIFAATPVAADPARIDPVSRWHIEIAEASARFGVPVAWIERVMRAESGGLTDLDGRPITSRAGAMGLMQLMPATWGAMRAQLRLGNDPYFPRDNILAGAAYLRAMYNRFGYPGLFAAYNAGPARYQDYLASGRAPPSETRFYLAEVTGDEPRAIGHAAGASASVFAILTVAPLPSGRQRTDQTPPSLFVTLSSTVPAR